jgi:hypothetical protein
LSNRISLRPTEIPGVFNFIITAPNLEEHAELYTGHEAVMDFIRANIGQRAHEITFGEILYLSPGRYVFRFDLTFKIRTHVVFGLAESTFAWLKRSAEAEHS